MKPNYYYKGYNVADWLTLYRIISFPFLLVFILLNKETWFSWFLLASFFTDAIDGYVARQLHIASERGAKLDSIGDTLTLIASIAGIAQFKWDFLSGHAVLLLVLIGLYVLEMILSYMRFGKSSSFHTVLDKISLVAFALFILSLFFIGYQQWIFYTAFVTGILATIEEIILVLSLKKYLTNIKGLFWLDKDHMRSFN